MYVHSQVNFILWHKARLAAYRLQQLWQSMSVTQPIAVDIEGYVASEGSSWWKKLMKNNAASHGPSTALPQGQHFLHMENCQLHNSPIQKAKIADKRFLRGSDKKHMTHALALARLHFFNYTGMWGSVVIGVFEMGVHNVRHLSSFDEMKVQLRYEKCHYVSPAATGGCEQFISGLWWKLQLQEHMTIQWKKKKKSSAKQI